MTPTPFSCRIGRQTQIIKFPATATTSAVPVDGAASHDVAAPVSIWYRRVTYAILGGLLGLIATYGLPYWRDGLCVVIAGAFALGITRWIAKEGGDL